MKWELPDVQVWFWRGRGTRDLIAKIRWIIEKPREFQKNFYFCFPDSSDGKECACNARDPDLIPGSGKSSGEGNDSPLQYSCLENPTDRGAWQATGHGVTNSRTWLSDWHFFFFASSAMLKPLIVQITWITMTWGKFQKEKGIPDHLTCLLRSL